MQLGIYLFFVLTSPLLLTVMDFQSNKESVATVEVLTLDGNGEVIPQDSKGGFGGLARIDLISDRSSENHGGKFRGIADGFVGKNIPYGYYSLRISLPGFRSYEQTLKIFQPNLSLRAKFDVSLNADQGNAAVNGMIRLDSNDKTNLWVKLMPILGNRWLMETRIDADGSFQFAEIDPGPYLLVVIRGDQVLHSQRLAISGKRLQKIEINLP